MEERLPGIENNCEYIELAVADSRQRVVLQLDVERGAEHGVYLAMLLNISHLSKMTYLR